jgi:ribonuclease HI
MAKSQKYYVVWEGHRNGVFANWYECKQQIDNYPGAKYKSFKSKSEAYTAFQYGDYEDYVSKTSKKKATVKNRDLSKFPIVWRSLAVDAACSGNPGKTEYRGVDTKTGDEIFRQGPFEYGTNNVGEFLALVHGLAYLKRLESDMPIYSDSKIAIGWVKKKVFRSKLARTKRNEYMFQLVDRGLTWLRTNDYTTEILKWETKEWGEIPADFGRK